MSPQEIAERYTDLFNFSSSGYLILSNEGEIIDLNHAGAKLMGKERLSLKNSMFSFFIEKENKPVFFDFLNKIFNENLKTTCELLLTFDDLLPKYVQLTGILTQSREQCLMTVVDITELRQANEYRVLTREILQLLNEPKDMQDSIHRTLDLLKTRIGVSAVGMRLQQGNDFPYVDQTGFSSDFMQLENALHYPDKKGKMCRDDSGIIQRTCACGMVLSGKDNSSNSFMTPGGSWWTNESFPLFTKSPEDNQGYLPRNECLLQGYGSIAIVPIRSYDKIVGLIHFNDQRKGFFNLIKIEFLEGIASHIGSAMLRKQSEEKLRKNEELLRTITDNAPGIILELDRQGTILYMNRPYEGYALGDCIGKDLLDWTYPVDHHEIKELLKSVFKGQATDAFQYRVKNVQKEVCWHRAVISPVNVGGVVKNAIMNTRDITDSLMNEALLKESEEKRKTLAMTSVDGFYVTDSQGRILEVNDAYSKISGYTEKELLSMRIQDLEVDENEEETARHFQRIMQKGVDRFETRHRCKDGTIISVEASVQYSSFAGGQFVTFLHDITKQREVESSLQLSDDRYKSLFQWNFSVILLIDPDTGAIIDANLAACEYYGWTYSELCQKTIFEIDPVSEEETLLKLQSSKDRKNNHLFVQHKLARGEMRDVEVFSGPIKINGSIMLYTIIHDITEMNRAQEALRVNEERYSFIYNSTRDSVFSLDLDGKLTSVNRSLCDEIHLEPPQIIGRTCFELGLPELLAKELDELQKQVLETDSSTLSEMEFPDAGGNIRYYELTLNPMHHASGEIMGIGGSVRLITERIEAEIALRKLNESLEKRVTERTEELSRSYETIKQAEEKYRTVSDFAFNWEFWLDPSDRMIYCSPASLRITGYTAIEFMENPQLIVDIIHPDDLTKYLKHKSSEKEAQVCEHEVYYRIFRKDGTIRWIGHFCSPVFDDSGTFKGIRGSNKDITARKKMLEMLTISNQKYHLLSENISDGIFICNKARFEYVNNAIYHIFGYEGHELDHLRLDQLITTDYHEELKNFLCTDSDVNQHKFFEVECLRKDLSPVYVEVFLNYVASNKLIYGVIHNVTERKELQTNLIKTIVQTEEKERASFSKELHDGLGPLLSTIKLYIHWLERHNQNKSYQEFIGKAREIVEDALITVKEISNKLNPLILINFGLEEAISSFVVKLKETSALNIVFESGMSKRTDIEIEATLYRVIIECINNTLKYAHAGNIMITLKDTENQIEIRYRDDGTGFDINDTLKQHKGLGLFNLINRMQTIGGKVDLQSVPGEGVNYLFTVKT